MRKNNKNKPDKPGWDLLRISMFGRDLPLYWTWILLGVFAVVTHLMIKLEIKEMTFEFLSMFEEAGEGNFRNAGYSFGGELEATDLEIVPYDAETGDRPIRIGRVVVETPGLFWLLRTSMPSWSPKARGTLGKLQKAADQMSDDDEVDNEYAPAERMAVRFEGVDWGDYGMHWMLPSLDWIGAYSGALFEAAGCERDGWWSQDEVRSRFDAPSAQGTIAIELDVTGPRTLKQKIAFASEGNSSVTIEREFALAGEAEDFLDSDPDAWRTTKVRWTVDDKGFVRARNAWCAKESKIGEPEFVERHLAAVRRTLLAKGFVPDPAVLETYRGYAERGGTLVWETSLAPGRALEDLGGHGPEAYLSGMNARLSAQGKPAAAYVGTFVTPREMPVGDEIFSVVDVLRLEGTLPVRGAPAPAAPAAVTVVAADATEANAIAAAVAAPISESAPASAAPAAPAPAAPAVAIDEPVAEDAAWEDEEPAAPPSLTVRDLIGQVGRGVHVTLASGRRYFGYVERADARSVSLRVAATSGWASLAFAHENITRIEVAASER